MPQVVPAVFYVMAYAILVCVQTAKVFGYLALYVLPTAIFLWEDEIPKTFLERVDNHFQNIMKTDLKVLKLLLTMSLLLLFISLLNHYTGYTYLRHKNLKYRKTMMWKIRVLLFLTCLAAILFAIPFIKDNVYGDKLCWIIFSFGMQELMVKAVLLLLQMQETTDPRDVMDTIYFGSDSRSNEYRDLYEMQEYMEQNASPISTDSDMLGSRLTEVEEEDSLDEN